MEDWQKLVLATVGVASTVGIGYYAVSRLITPPCAPGSACASAIASYVDAWQICANEYATLVRSDIANKIDLASDTQLSYLTQCMNTNAEKIANISKSYNYDWEAVVEQWGQDIITGALVITGIYAFFKAGGAGLIATAVRSGAGAANKLLHIMTRFMVRSGAVDSVEASALTNQLPTISDALQGYTSNIFDALATDEIITAEEAAELISEDITNIVTDFTATLDELASLL